MSALQESIGFLGHELNTPLATVRLSVSGVASRYIQPKTNQAHPAKAQFQEDEPGELLALLEGAEAQALYCQSLVEQVMKSAFHFRLTSTQEVSAIELVKSLVDTYPFTAVERTWIDLKFLRDFKMTGSRELFFLVLSTVTKNALLSLRNRPKPYLVFEVSGDADQQGVGRIRISDSGIGIPKATLESLSKSVVRSTWPDVEGAGMGLMFCARVMEACNGSLSIESELGQGSTVTLKFSPSWIQV